MFTKGPWRTLISGVWTYQIINTVGFKTIQTDRVRVRIATRQDGPLNRGLMHGARLVASAGLSWNYRV